MNVIRHSHSKHPSSRWSFSHLLRLWLPSWLFVLANCSSRSRGMVRKNRKNVSPWGINARARYGVPWCLCKTGGILKHVVFFCSDTFVRARRDMTLGGAEPERDLNASPTWRGYKSLTLVPFARPTSVRQKTAVGIIQSKREKVVKKSDQVSLYSIAFWKQIWEQLRILRIFRK